MQFSQILAFTLVAFSAAPSAFAKPMPVDTTNLAPAVALKYEALEYVNKSTTITHNDTTSSGPQPSAVASASTSGASQTISVMTPWSIGLLVAGSALVTFL